MAISGTAHLARSGENLGLTLSPILEALEEQVVLLSLLNEVHPKAETVHGQKGYEKLSDIPFPIDVVDIFVNSDLAGEVVDSAIAINAKGVWLQLDVIDQSAFERAANAGLVAVMNRCPAIEYGKRL